MNFLFRLAEIASNAGLDSHQLPQIITDPEVVYLQFWESVQCKQIVSHYEDKSTEANNFNEISGHLQVKFTKKTKVIQFWRTRLNLLTSILVWKLQYHTTYFSVCLFYIVLLHYETERFHYGNNPCHRAA